MLQRTLTAENVLELSFDAGIIQREIERARALLTPREQRIVRLGSPDARRASLHERRTSMRCTNQLALEIR